MRRFIIFLFINIGLLSCIEMNASSLTISSSKTQPQTSYLIKDQEGFDFILNVFVNGNTINGFTRQKALLDYTSRLNYQVIKAVSLLKHPEVIRFNATLADGDFEGTYDHLFSSYKIVGRIDGDAISYSLFTKDNQLYKSFKGEKIINYTKKDYKIIAEDVIKITEENIFDPKIIQSKKWKDFSKKIRSASENTYDDMEFQTGFFALIRKIGFSHYYIVKNDTSTIRKREKSTLDEIDKSTVLLKISNFYESKENIIPLLDSIRIKEYNNLIIDLRDNAGGSFESALVIADFLTDKVFTSGFFPNKNWYEKYDRYPEENDILKFHNITEVAPENDSNYGFYIRTKGSEDNYKGNTYILVNKKTGSTAEALIIGAKENKLAKIIGQKTAGGLLNAKQFKIDKDIILVVPINDFISYNGYRVDQKGISPDMIVKEGTELEHIKKLINKDN